MRMKKRIVFQEEAKTKKTDEKRILCKFTLSDITRYNYCSKILT